eukprot:10893964-Lingulodinium_polyedra.AAC.1
MLSHLSQASQFLDALGCVSDLLRHKWFRERFVETCVNQQGGRRIAYLFDFQFASVGALCA